MDAREAETTAAGPGEPAGPWDGQAFAILSEWDPAFAQSCLRMTTAPWADGLLPRKTVELIGVALDAGGGARDPEGARRHIRAALEAGASRDEILAVLELASTTSITACGPAARVLLEEAEAAGLSPGARERTPVRARDEAEAAGPWTGALGPFVEIDPEWTDAVIGSAVCVQAKGVLEPKLVALLGVALAISQTHMDAQGLRPRIRAALDLGAAVDEVAEVLKLRALQGVEACNQGVPILAQELVPAQERIQEGSPGRDPAGANKKSDRADAISGAERKPSLKEKAVREAKRFLVMFLYLWIVLGLFVLHESIILAEHHINYKSYGFAFVNALVLAKVMLLAEDLRLGARFQDRPLIVPILMKSFLFAATFIAAHVSEKVIVGLFEGKSVLQSIPAVGGSLAGAVLVGIILSVALIPFFAFAELGRVMEKGELARLIFTLGARSDRRSRGVETSG